MGTDAGEMQDHFAHHWNDDPPEAPPERLSPWCIACESFDHSLDDERRVGLARMHPACDDHRLLRRMGFRRARGRLVLDEDNVTAESVGGGAQEAPLQPCRPLKPLEEALQPRMRVWKAEGHKVPIA